MGEVLLILVGSVTGGALVVWLGGRAEDLWDDFMREDDHA